MHSSSLLCCHSSLATEAFDVLQISNFIIENPLLLPSPPLLSLTHPLPPPSLLSRLNKLFCLTLPSLHAPPPSLNAEVKKLKALQKRLFVWVNYSLGCACMCQMYVCVRLYVHASVGESCAGSGVEQGFCDALSLVVLDRLHPLSLVTLLEHAFTSPDALPDSIGLSG